MRKSANPKEAKEDSQAEVEVEGSLSLSLEFAIPQE